MEFDLSNISKVYSGKANCCCCGCSGNYYYPETNKHRGIELRGYELLPVEISDRMVKRVTNKLAQGKFDKVRTIGNNIISAIVGKREYNVYLLKDDPALIDYFKELPTWEEI